ncbi:fungal-specific transcription factor domain-containing protein [Talaromyces proteolyticus]|uniref:Fungal-specific transcription factor domain-containing protein n=1 Tax=Talaromyces proteolyticus TaxID=1131652 RepID=A0AAD4KN49_9EURO|nr:fungal-specific transcription factor domain-containing protein [Talaromyces proteolyticus]KAH8694100.1 fungal-specific transcription factor domain-containing protein [Talaromyces proteolyticus]
MSQEKLSPSSSGVAHLDSLHPTQSESHESQRKRSYCTNHLDDSSHATVKCKSKRCVNRIPFSSSNTSQISPRFCLQPVHQIGQIAYRGESTNLSLIMSNQDGNYDVVHVPLEMMNGPPNNYRLDDLERDRLHRQGAFLLPPRSLREELIAAFFKCVAPMLPILNKHQFMRRYRDSSKPPSLLLLQSVFLVGLKVSTSYQLHGGGRSNAVAMAVYKRAKALYDADYESDRVAVVQSLILIGWYWDGSEDDSDVTHTGYYWTCLAIAVAQGSGMHRSLSSSLLGKPETKLRRRLFWTLFTRDVSGSLSLNRPPSINMRDCDIEPLVEDDFLEGDFDGLEGHSHFIHRNFFLKYVELCKLLGLVRDQISKPVHSQFLDNVISIKVSQWLESCPEQLIWSRSKHDFWSALLQLHYNATICLLHGSVTRPFIEEQVSPFADGTLVLYAQATSFRASGTIISIVNCLFDHDEIRFLPASAVYSLHSALAIQVQERISTNYLGVAPCWPKVGNCMGAVEELERVWPVAKSLYPLLGSILKDTIS